MKKMTKPKMAAVTLLALIMTLTCFGAIGVVFDKDASALIKDYKGESNTVYYFSDCDPIISEWMESENKRIEDNSILYMLKDSDVHIYQDMVGGSFADDKYFWDVLYGDYDTNNRTGITYDELKNEPFAFTNTFLLGKWKLHKDLYELCTTIQAEEEKRELYLWSIYIWEATRIDPNENLVITNGEDMKGMYEFPVPTDEEKVQAAEDLGKMVSVLR